MAFDPACAPQDNVLSEQVLVLAVFCVRQQERDTKLIRPKIYSQVDTVVLQGVESTG